MTRDPAQPAIDTIKAIYGRWRRETTIAQMRADWNAAFAPLAQPWPRTCFTIGNVPAEWIVPPGRSPSRALLYLHGGGFRLGSIASHRDLIQRLAVAADARVLAINYRLAPEHVFPAALDDAFAAWQWLTSNADGQPLGVAGDSAGGGLAISTVVWARDAGVTLPSAIYLLSPWTDLAASGASYMTQAERDPIHTRGMILAMAKSYLGPATDAREPLASPLYADLTRLPPTLIHCGGREVILDDSRLFADAASAQGAKVTLDIFGDMIHVFPMFAVLPQAQKAIGNAGHSLNRMLGG